MGSGRPANAPFDGEIEHDASERSIGEMFRALSYDAARLVRQEIAIARAEAREKASRALLQGVKVGAGSALAVIAVLAIAAFVITLLGDVVLDGAFWLAALAVGLVLLITAGLLAWRAMAHLKRQDLLPVDTIGTLRDDAGWAKREAAAFRERLTGHDGDGRGSTLLAVARPPAPERALPAAGKTTRDAEHAPDCEWVPWRKGALEPFFKRLLHEAKKDNLTGEGAKVAYYAFLALFPLILSLFAVTGLIGGETFFQWFERQIQGAVPQQTAEMLKNVIAQITGTRSPGALSVGLLLTLYAASGVFAALTDGLNAMHGVEETRSWIRKRLLALAMLLGNSILLLAGAVTIIGGGKIGEALGLGPIWSVIQLPLSLLLLVGFMWVNYYFLPNRDQSGHKKAVLVGAVLGAAIWIVVSLGFRFYVDTFGNYNKTYGFIAGAIILLLWMNYTALAILLGGEVASVLEGPKGWKDRPRTEAA